MKRIWCIVMAMAVLLLTACAGQTVKQVELSAVMDSLAGKYGLDEGMLELTEMDLMDLYGIDSALVKQYEARIRLESIQADEIVLIEATDAKAAAQVKEQLEARYQTKLNETRNYLPDEFAKIEKCKVAQHGNYVSMIVCAEAEAAVAEYEKALK